ncbi:response regulator transcription factor [Rahnella woolbedingensis]|uniref:DNA-binding response regulator n=1 Tax=Rahnella woolbedingensis TaxID=1510574 RepID=A0A419N9F5_9GAMM|nr:response regulator transcription factor [Rahnella woolbedingensis]RJT44360.1 DNA-binding response regulator [Rahnella woolbedingensis]
MYKALIVDDHPVIRMAIEILLNRNNISVVGKAGNGAEAVQMAKSLEPNLIILDIAIPVLNGLEVISRIRAISHSMKILILTSQLASSFSARCRQAGASGYVEKTEELNELLDAIRAIRSGYTYFPAENIPVGHTKTLSVGDEAERLASLSDREMIVLVYLAKGYSNMEIGEMLTLSNKTISTYKTRLLMKLGMKTLVDLISLAFRHKLVD